MFYCNDCKNEFSEPSFFKERLEHFGTPCRNFSPECPYCGSNDFCEKIERDLFSGVLILKAAR